MRWRSVAIAGLMLPAAAGCNIAHNAARNLINEPHVVWTEHELKHDLRKAAREAFEAARGECPEHADSAVFRDGFIDGYVDYLDRGGNASLPAVPPAKYTRHEKYFTEDGQCRVREYFLGFKFGQDVAVASGRRQLLTVPVLLPQEPSGPPTFNLQPVPGEPPMIPPQPPPGVEALSPISVSVGPAAAPAVAVPGAGREMKSAPPGDFQPSAKPAPLPKPPDLSSSAPLPLPAPPGPAGPSEWGELPAIPPTGDDSAPPVIPVPAAETPGRGVLPPNHSVRPPLPPNHPKPRQ